MPSCGEDYGRSLAHKMLSPLAPFSKTSLSTLIQQYLTPFVCFPSAPFLLNQSGWRVCGWGTDCSNVRGHQHRRREPIEQTCIGHHPLIDPPLMVAKTKRTVEKEEIEENKQEDERRKLIKHCSEVSST
ncbi:unnamed protein product [Leuciscus chuanchicus]